jgi:prepilin-type N-terminal cleavage/methylation domain-containing protein
MRANQLSNRQIRLLSYITTAGNGNGFTLIELLVVVIILSVLTAIALPSMLNQSNRARQAEAKMYVGALVRAQQAYFSEHSQFAADLTMLVASIPAETSNYTYTITLGGGPNNANVVVSANAKTDVLRSYSGMVELNVVEATREAINLTALCETNQPGVPAIAPTPSGGTATPPTCGPGSIRM